MPEIHYDTVEGFGGWAKAPAELVEIILRHKVRRILEVGAGANPSLAPDQVAKLGVEYTTNDVLQSELDKADGAYRKLCHDFSRDGCPESMAGTFDLVFSRMVNEHVEDGRLYHRNLRRLLRDGGLSLHWFSTLYAFPFLANWLLPESLTGRLLRAFAPRDEHRAGKFRAHYSWSRGPTQDMIRKFESTGFEVIEYRGYFGHTYYRRRFPLLHSVEMRKAAWLVRHPVPALTSYSRVLLRASASAGPG